MVPPAAGVTMTSTTTMPPDEPVAHRPIRTRLAGTTPAVGSSGARGLGGEPLLVVRLVDALVDIRFREQQRRPTVADRLLGDDALADVGALRDVEHHLEQRFLDDRAQRSGAGLAVDRDGGGGAQRP